MRKLRWRFRLVSSLTPRVTIGFLTAQYGAPDCLDREQHMPKTSETSRGEKYLVGLLAFAVLVLFVLLAWPMWTNRLYTYDDLVNFHIPFLQGYWQAISSGDSFLWSPRIFCGYYMLGDGQLGMCHPLHWVLYKTLPFELAFNLSFALNYAWLFAGMFFLLQRWRLSRPAALMGSLIFTFSGFSILHFMHINALGVVSQLPWLLLACDVLMCSKDLKRIALAQLAIALLTASQHLMGYPQFVIFSLIVEVAVVLWRMFDAGSWRRIPLFALAIVLGFMIGAVQLLPTWDSLSLSDRAETSLEFRTWFSMHPLNVIRLWAPFVFRDRYYATVRVLDGNTHEMGLYTTAFSTVALAWLAIRWRKLPQRWFLLGTFLFGLVMLVLAFGKYTWIYPLVAELPVIKSLPLRCPSRYAMLTQLAMAVLAACAMSDLLTLRRKGERVKWLALWPLGVVLLLAGGTAATALLAASQPENPWFQLGTTSEILSGFGLLAGAVGLVTASARGARWGVYGIVLLTAAEVGAFNIWQYLWKVGPPETLQEVVDSISPPPPPNTGRLCHLENVHGNVLALAGYELMQGYTALAPVDRIPLIQRTANGQLVLNLVALRLASVHWVLSDKERWLAAPAPLPRARLVSKAMVSSEEAIAVQQIDPATTAIVDREVELEFGPGTATIVTERPGRLEIETDTVTQQLLVVSARYHPGWQATVDGAPAAVLPAYGQYLSCVVPAGARRVELHFLPASFVWGMRITLASLASALLFAAGTVLWARWRPIAGPCRGTVNAETVISGPRKQRS